MPPFDGLRSCVRGRIPNDGQLDLPEAEKPLRPLRPLPVALTLAIVLVLLAWGLIDVQRRARIESGRPDAHRTDFTVYTEAAKAFLEGDADPYLVANPRGWQYIYPPPFALLVSPLAYLPYRVQAFAWYALSVLFAWGAIVEVRRLLRVLVVDARSDGDAMNPAGVLPRSLGVGALLAVLFPALNCLQRGQVSIFLVYFLLLGARVALSARSVRGALLGGIILALPAAVKVTPALPVGFFVLGAWAAGFSRGAPNDRDAVAAPSRLGRAGALTVGSALGLALWLLLAPAAVIGWETNLHHLDTWVHRVAAPSKDVGIQNNFDAHSFRNQSLSNAASLVTVPWSAKADGTVKGDGLAREWPHSLARIDTPAGMVLAASRAGIVAILLALAVSTAIRPSRLRWMALFGLSTTATLLISPISWGHHFVIQLPALVFVPLAAWRSGHRRLALALAYVPAALSLAHYLALPWTGAYGVLGLGTAAWFLAAAGFILLWKGGDVASSADEHPLSRTAPREESPLPRGRPSPDRDGRRL